MEHPKVIELGGGNSPVYCRAKGNGLNVDMRSSRNVDLITDFEKPLPLNSNEFDLVYSAYVLEHISWRNVKAFIREIYRILRPNGKTLIVTANLFEQCKVVANSREWNENFSCMIFGNLDYPENSHKCGFSPDYALRLFKDAGFSKVIVYTHPNCVTDMIVEGFK